MRRRKRKSRRLAWSILIILVCLAGAVYLLKGQDEQKAQPEKQQDEAMPSMKPIKTDEKPADQQKEKPEVTFFTQENLDEKVNHLIKNMTLKEKIGQLIVVGLPGQGVDSGVTEMIKDYHAGGIILFDRNMKNQQQVGELNSQLQNLAMKDPLQIPLMVSIDQEGGLIVRMRDQVAPKASQHDLGVKKNSQAVYQQASTTAKELLNMGVNVNFAPVLDISDKDSRSFGSDPKLVSIYGAQVIKGLTDGGITATVKHFPGNGRSSIDPHKDTSSVQADKKELESSDIYPFKSMIDQMDNDKFFVMVTHIKYPAFDQENPASLSSKIKIDLLRKQLGFKGIVVTDDLEMGAVHKYYSNEDLGYKAVETGADLLLVCHTLQSQKEVYNGILSAVQSHKLSEQRIDEAVERILRFKLKNETLRQSGKQELKK